MNEVNDKDVVDFFTEELTKKDGSKSLETIRG